MKLSTRTRYGTRALLELALRGDNGPVLLRDIARRQRISLPYLEQLMAPLVAGGIIRSTKGPGGGISLARKPEQIHLDEVMRLLEGVQGPVECVINPGVCERSGSCPAHDVWCELREVMERFLRSRTLRDLADKEKRANSVLEHSAHKGEIRNDR